MLTFLKRNNITFLITKPTRCTNFSNLFLEWNSTCFGQFLCPSSEFFTVHTATVYVIQVCWKLVSRIRTECPDPAVWHDLYDIYHCRCVQWKTPDDGRRNCLKHVEFHSKNKFEKLVHLVGFIIRNLTWCTVMWMSKITSPYTSNDVPWRLMEKFQPQKSCNTTNLLTGSSFKCHCQSHHLIPWMTSVWLNITTHILCGSEQ